MESYLRQFGEFRLDIRKKVLWHKGRAVSMPLKELEVLCVLVESKGELVTKGELLDKIWHDSFVEESNLSRHIYLLRKTLKDLGGKNDSIQNVPRRGYRFTDEVREVEAGDLVVEKHTSTHTLIEIQEDLPEPAGGPGHINTKRSWKTGIVAVLFVALAGSAAFLGYQFLQVKTSGSQIKSIAVLPFSMITPTTDDSYQGLGLADQLITRLSSIKNLNVRPTSAVLAFENENAYTAGEKLQVDAVLEGAIHHADGRVLITARLVKTSDSTTVWTGEFEKLDQDALRLQTDIALQIVEALRLNLSGDEMKALTKRYTEIADAQRLYEQGRHEWNKRNWAGMSEAQRLFRNAIERDPNFALAYVGLADTLAISAEPAEAFSAAQKALELDPGLAEAHASMGFLHMFHEWRWNDAENSFKRSIELNPGYATAHHWYATLLGIKGRFGDAKAQMKRALEINPVSHNFLADLGQIHYFAREYAEAENYCRRSLEIYPDFEFAHAYLFHIYLKTGEFEKAVDEKLAATKISGSFAGAPVEEKERTEKHLLELKAVFQKSGIDAFMRTRIDTRRSSHHYNNAATYAFLGERENALTVLEKAYENKSFLIAFIKADPVFDNLHDEPRYQQILRRMNLAD